MAEGSNYDKTVIDSQISVIISSIYSAMLYDPYHRLINYLRISVTDRCNLRCVYCMPADGVHWKPHSKILTFEEIRRICEAAADLGISRLRLTGGEPLVRKGITGLVGMLAEIPGIEEISLTTNGILLNHFAKDLKSVGLKRVNVSLDTLDPLRFSRITRQGNIGDVWQGIHAAEDAGLLPIKLNCVVIRGVNEDELLDIACLSIDHPWEVRFIEIMPVENEQTWGEEFPQAGGRFISIAEIKTKLSGLGLREAINQGNGPSISYQIPGAKGTVGFISPIGEHFCSTCNRLRLTADGNLRPCLLHNIEIPLRAPLLLGEDLKPYFVEALHQKPASHALNDQTTPVGRLMSQIGG